MSEQVVLTEVQKEGLIAAGGCLCTPIPWQGCDTCGRAISPFWLTQRGMLAAFDWKALSIDGAEFTKEERRSIDNLPLDRIAELNVATTSPRAPTIRVSVDPAKDERLYMFTRHFARMNMRTGAGSERFSCVVIEIVPDAAKPDKFVRLYVTPQGLILSTQDVYL